MRFLSDSFLISKSHPRKSFDLTIGHFSCLVPSSFLENTINCTFFACPLLNFLIYFTQIAITHIMLVIFEHSTLNFQYLLLKIVPFWSCTTNEFSAISVLYLLSTSVPDHAALAEPHHHALVRQGQSLHAPLEGNRPGVAGEVHGIHISILNGCQ